jgi:hypothetical protein
MFDTPLLRWLKPLCGTNRWGHRHRPSRRSSFVPRLLVLEDRTLPSTFTVMNNLDSSDGSLRAAIAAAQGGDQIVFDPSLRGQTITLTSGELAISKSLDIEGLGADQLTISGNHASRIFNISGGVTVTIAGLTMFDGRVIGGPARGGAILMNAATNLTVANDVFSNNEALGLVGNGNGVSGAIDDVGAGATLTVTHCQFLHNLAMGFFQANAGAIHCSGSTTVTDSTFIANQCIGGSGGTGVAFGFSRGGAIYENTAGILTVANCTFIGNQAIAGSGNSSATYNFFVGYAFGGGIGVTDQSVLFLSGSTFTDNRAIGGSNNTGGSGIAQGGGLASAWEATVTDCTFEHNEALAGSGNTGRAAGFSQVGCAFGGGIYSGRITGAPGLFTASHLTLRNNRAIGSAGNAGGDFLGEAGGGGLFNGIDTIGVGTATATVSDSTIADNEALGGQGADGANGGDALGGGIANVFGSILTVSGGTLTGNRAGGGAGGSGGNGGGGLGGGLFNDGPSTAPSNLGDPTILTVFNSRIVNNEAEGGAGSTGGLGGNGFGGGLYVAGGDETVTVTVADSRIERNEAEGGDGGGRHHHDDGQGIGGGVYIKGGMVCITNTRIKHNHADTSNDDVFGVFTTDC